MNLQLELLEARLLLSGDYPAIDGTGSYTVRLALPPGLQQTSWDPPTFLISRGNMSASGVNFRVAPAWHGPSPFGRLARSPGGVATGLMLDPFGIYSPIVWTGQHREQGTFSC
jgi:hypothetical protein